MNINQLLTEIESVDSEVYDRLDSRRDAVRSFAKTGGRIALAAVPLMLGGMFKKAYAGNRVTPIINVLNFALTLEYLESEFYRAGLKTKRLIPMGTDMEGFNQIFEHEYRHVDFLRSTITSMGGKPVQKPSFDFTAGGTFPTVFSNYDVFLAVSQTFEDTGVRAYKGQAANLISNHEVLTAALQIHSVEARHASFLRQLRSERAMDESIRPWITGSSTAGIGSAVQPNYAGEDNTIQAGINIVNINGYPISFDDATEAFDEILTMEQVLAIVKPFIV